VRRFEPVGNHARLNYYQPGALIHRGFVVCDTNPTSNLTTLDAWTTVTDGVKSMSLAYTPPVDAVAEVTAKIAAYHTTQYEPVQFSIYQGASSISYMTWKMDHKDTVEIYEWSTTPRELVGGTAYTFTCKYYVSNITLTLVGAEMYSYFKIMVRRKP